MIAVIDRELLHFAWGVFPDRGVVAAVLLSASTET